jgi:hypothetical protein
VRAPTERHDPLLPGLLAVPTALGGWVAKLMLCLAPAALAALELALCLAALPWLSITYAPWPRRERPSRCGACCATDGGRRRARSSPCWARAPRRSWRCT